MNVYDFDKTIYDGDCSMDFYFYNLKNNKHLIKRWPQKLNAFFNYKRDRISKTEMKDMFYQYFMDIDNLEEEVNKFWDLNQHKIKSWYLLQKREDDVIVSASPEFLLKPICDRLGIDVIGSVVDMNTGKNIKPNCYGQEKVTRFKEKYELEDIELFYSDSYSDDPLASYAEKSFLVKGDKLLPW